MTTDEATPVFRLSLGNWIGLVITILTVVTGACVGLITFSYNLAESGRRDALQAVAELDNRWDKRLNDIVNPIRLDVQQIKQDFREIKDAIPPEWFREIVDSNKRSIEVIRERLLTLEQNIFRINTRLDKEKNE